jgi:CheY-like chemotaxis protein
MADPEPSQVDPSISALTVLLVDDVQENLDLLEDIFREQGYQTVSTRSPFEALEIVRREDIHIIVADAMMPKMDGLELCKNIKRDQAKATIPYIIYTGNYIDLEDEDLARSIGVDRYVMKYEGTRPLLEAVGDIVRARYGLAEHPPGVAPAAIDEHAFLQRHHELMTKKLEEKMVELQLYADTLEMKNRELIVSEKRYRTLFENASVAIFVIDKKQRRIVDVNRQALAILDCSPTDFPDIVDLPFLDISGTPMDLFSLGQTIAHEGVLKTRTGEKLDVDISAGPVDQPNDTRIMLFVRDITETKRIREHLLQTEKMALMGRLAAGIAHERAAQPSVPGHENAGGHVGT